MKKLLIGLCAASLLAASAISYAGSVTLVNRANQPVTFVVSQGAVYNPVVLGTLQPGGKSTVLVSGPFTTDTHFMAYKPDGRSVVTDCGSPYYGSLMNVEVKAGRSMETGMFACRIYDLDSVQKTCPNKKH